jgi:hypothetical protein
MIDKEFRWIMYKKLMEIAKRDFDMYGDWTEYRKVSHMAYEIFTKETTDG